VHHESVISILVGGQIGYVVFPEISRNFLNINSLTVGALQKIAILILES